MTSSVAYARTPTRERQLANASPAYSNANVRERWPQKDHRIAAARAARRETRMSDDKTNAKAQDRGRINLDQPYELRDWAKKFGVSKEELVGTVRKVGNRASDVEAHLNTQR